MTSSAIVDDGSASQLVSGLLVGAWIVGIEYWRNGWNINFAVEEDHKSVKAGLLAHPFELVLSATELVVAEPQLWSKFIAAAPVDIEALSDLHDGLAALLLFNSVAYRVTGAKAMPNGDLLLCFEGSRSLIFRGHVPNADDEWSIANRWRDEKNAEPVFVGADAGTLYAFPHARGVLHAGS